MCVCVCQKRMEGKKGGRYGEHFYGRECLGALSVFSQGVPANSNSPSHRPPLVRRNEWRSRTDSKPKMVAQAMGKSACPFLFVLDWIKEEGALLGGLIKGTPRKSHGAGHDIHRDICVSALLSSRARAFRPR